MRGLLFDGAEPYCNSLLVNDLRGIYQILGHLPDDRFYAALLAADISLVPEIAEQSVEGQITDAVVSPSDELIPLSRALQRVVQGRGTLRQPLGKCVLRIVPRAAM